MWRNGFLLTFFLTSLLSFSVCAEEGLQDPTKPTFPEEAGNNSYTREGPPFELNAIMFFEKSPIAIVNGKVLHLHESIGDYTLSKITSNEIILMPKKNGEKTIKLIFETNNKNIKQKIS